MNRQFIGLALLLGLLVVGCKNSPKDAARLKPSVSFVDGQGTKTSPYIIHTAAQLAWLSELVNTNRSDLLNGGKFANKFYRLGADIDLSDYGSESNDGKGWIPIGNDYYKRFGGHFEGANKKITGLYIHDHDADYVGLFGSIFGGTVQNLTIEMADGGVTGKDQVGGLAGNIDDGGRVQNCDVTGVVSGNSYVGGVAGYFRVSSLIHCCFAGEINGTGDCVGGLIGRIESSALSNCFALSPVTGTGSFTGGLVGSVSCAFSATEAPESRIENCYATGHVTGVEDVGGLIGTLWEGSLINCAALSDQIEGTKNVGRFVGFNRFGSVLGNISSLSIHAKQQATYAGLGWDFDAVWQIDEGKYYPTLQGLTTALLPF